MLRSMPLTAESPHPLARIRSAFESDAYWLARLGAFEGGSPTLDSLTTDSTGTTSVAMTMRFGGDQLPDPLRRLRLASLHVVQREQWYAIEGGAAHGVIAIDALRTPISGHGAVHLTPAESRTHLTGTATVEVNVPLVGAAIAKFVAGQLATGIIDIVRVTDSWLSQQS